MTASKLAFISVKPIDSHFVASISMDDLDIMIDDTEHLLNDIANLYATYISAMKIRVEIINSLRQQNKRVMARSIWHLGDDVFRLIDELKSRHVQLDSIYEHLVRDLGISRKWLEKVIITRRYIPNIDSIPETMTWGSIEKGTRRKALLLQNSSK